MHLRAVEANMDEFRRFDCQVVAVQFYRQMENQEKWRSIVQCDQEQIADPERVIYKLFGLGRLPVHANKWITMALNGYAGKLASGHEVFSDTEPGDDYQAGGDAIVTQEGNVVYSFRGSTPGLRPPVEELLSAFDKHSSAAQQ